MNKIEIKSDKEIEIMKKGGAKLKRIKNALKEKIAVGVSAWEIEKIANKTIDDEGGTASFKMVDGYKWATCINVNEGVVHGIPKKEVLFKENDIVSVDVGLYYMGFHTDTSFSVLVGNNQKRESFLQTGREALSKALKNAKSGKRIYDISEAIEKTLSKKSLNPVKSLVGHGVGKALHEEPQIPCFTVGKRGDSPEIKKGMVLAIEVMYTLGSPDLVLESDGWTISTRDGKISGLFEETVAVIKNGPLVIT